MEYVDLANERLANWDREIGKMRQRAEAQRLGLAAPAWSPFVHLDGLLIRASKGAAERQARRDIRTDHKELVS